ncbi:glycosyltransferase family 4 protein [uncultured Roseobacter sp.]|uniref:glycosyltransferase family 4 protein n=1 Tax=uncultured Roseobacter sp. TaxID=114847 RepID=UPI00261B88B9|nr:glycosyltransferase family 4 protein [uncultured Roseobacter sp.]
MRVLYLTPTMNKMSVGEAYVAFKWAEALSEIVDLTVLTFHPSNPAHGQLAEQLPRAEVVTWPMPKFPKRLNRLVAMLKPNYPIYARHVRRWLAEARAEGRHFDLGHQIMPQAARYASPLQGAGFPYIIGPLGGSLSTPAAFQHEDAGSAQWFTALRKLDPLRFQYDPWLRRSYAQADMILGVAPYVEDVLGAIELKRFEVVLELGVDAVPPARPPRQGEGLRLLHVGRGVRTKGLRDVVRAMAALKDLPNVTLTSAGEGPELAFCKAEAEKLGVADRITFEGQVPRARVEELYQTHDIFAFPSFREPAGNVLYEAMRNSLPVIAADRGGPAFIVDDTVGIKLPVSTPEALAAGVADAVRRLYHNPAERARLGQGARDKLEREGRWPTKAQHLVSLYRSIAAPSVAQPDQDVIG